MIPQHSSKDTLVSNRGHYSAQFGLTAAVTDELPAPVDPSDPDRCEALACKEAAMTIGDAVPPLSERVDRLFVTFHASSEPEQSAAQVAQSVSALLDRPVSADHLAALRTGQHADGLEADTEVLAAVATHFHVPADYLLADTGRVVDIHRELHLLAATRDAGIRHMDFRGHEIDIDELANRLDDLAGKLADPDA